VPQTLRGRPLLFGLLVVLVAACGSGTSATPSPTEAPPTALPTSEVTAEPTLPEDTGNPAATPSRQDAYQQLLVSIPPEIAAKCESIAATVPMETGQLGQADCSLPKGSLADFVSYSLFADQASMDAFFDTQRKAHEKGGTATGPGCGKGPGEGTWDNGRKDCYLFVVNDAQVMWTHDLLFIFASAFRDDGDFAKLEQFWKTAGPVTP
jgi:hypothetical protein